MIERKVVVGPFQCNCRIWACPATGHALISDPGDEPERILKALRNLEAELGKPLQVQALVHTHAHLDHFGGTRKVREALGAGAQIFLHRADHALWKILKQQGQLFGIQYDDPLEVDHFLEHEEEFQVGQLKLSVIHTPGHSPGSIAIRLHEDSQSGAREMLLSGDTLFFESVGRTDLWGGNQEQMFESIRNRLLTLDGDTLVCPGHGPDTMVKHEIKRNPFLN